MIMNTMTTVSEVLNKLKERGYTVDFNLSDNCLICQGDSLKIYPEDFKVDKHYRFEGPSDPGDEAIVYAISSAKHQLKGTLVNGYGVSSDAMTHEMIKALSEINSYNDQQNQNEEAEKATAPKNEADVSLRQFDLKASIQQIKQEPQWLSGDRNVITLYKSDRLRIVLFGLHENALLKEHTAPGSITVQVLEGAIKFQTAEQYIDLETGHMITLKTGIQHSVLALKDAVFLLTIAIS
jgi:quercetin dioxygenase-like cupin family protein